MEQARQDLVANISHDLRTPLTAIQGFTEAIAAEDAPPEERRQDAAIVAERIRALNGMLGDLLELSRLQALPAVRRAPGDLPELVREQVKERYSLGMKQRLGIAIALLGRPRLLVLDEPTNGLDPEGFREIRSLLKLLVAERGIFVLLSSHLLHEVEQVATRVGVIREGRLLAEATVDELRHRSERSLEIGVDRPAVAAALIRERTALPVEELDSGTLVVRGKAQAAAINALLVRNDHNVSRLVEREPNLEEIFFALTGGTAHA